MSSPCDGAKTEIPAAPTLPLPPTTHSSWSCAGTVKGKTGPICGTGGEGTREQLSHRSPRTSTLRLEEICSTILWPPAFQGWARTEGRGRDLGGGQAFSTGSSFAPHVPTSTPHWSFELYSLPAWWNKCYIAENKLISFGWQHIPSGYNVAPFWKGRRGQLYISSSTRECFAVKTPVTPHALTVNLEQFALLIPLEFGVVFSLSAHWWHTHISSPQIILRDPFSLCEEGAPRLLLIHYITKSVCVCSCVCFE